MKFDPEELKRESRQLQANSDRNRIEFLKTEIESSFTFAGVAETEFNMGDRAGAARSLAHAEEGYATLLRFLSDPKHAAHIGEEERSNIDARVQRLRTTLDRLKAR